MFAMLLMSATLGAEPVKVEAVDPAKELYGASLFPERKKNLLQNLAIKLPEKVVESPLGEIIEYLENVGSPKTAATNPLTKTKITIDFAAFRSWKIDRHFMADEEMIRLPKATDFTLEKALREICSQMNGTYIVRSDSIEITTREKAIGRRPEENEEITLVTWAAKKMPLEDLLEQISEHYQVTIVIAASASEKARTPITAKFMNVPLETVVESLAEMASLNVVRKDNLYLLTTSDVLKSTPKLFDSRK